MPYPTLLIGFAEMAADCYNEDNFILGDLHGWRRSRDPRIGSATDRNFYACAYQHKKTGFVTLAFRGTANLRDAGLADAAGIGLSLNSLAMNVQPALDFAYVWSQKTKDIWLVGHSLGGAYVQIAAAIWKMYGVTFNAPGVLHLLNQFSQHPLTKFGGSLCNPVMQILLRSFGRTDLVSFFSEALAANDDLPFAAVANYRAQNDPVSLLGVQIGTPATIINVDPAIEKIHRMATIVEALGGAYIGRRPNELRLSFEAALERVRRSYRLCVYGYVIMPEHVHLLLSEPERQTLAEALTSLKQGVARRLIGEAEAFWQKRYYDFNVHTSKKFVEKLRYIHRNPVRRGLCQRPEDWEGSSFLHYATGCEGRVEIESELTARRRERAAGRLPPAIELPHSNQHRA